jgi:hypothetical protein
MANTTVTETFRFDLANGDSYVGEVVFNAGGVVRMRNYSAWYQESAESYDSPYVDDEVSFRVDGETRMALLS